MTATLATDLSDADREMVERAQAKRRGCGCGKAVSTLPGGDPPMDRETLSRAIGRYYEDQRAQAEHASTRRLLRYTGRRDVRVLIAIARFLINCYDMGTSFVAAHIGGTISGKTLCQRASYCRACTYRRRRESPNLPSVPVTQGEVMTRRDYCGGYSPGGKACECPTSEVWRPGKLPWQLKLRFFRCPLGHFGYGSHVPALPVAIEAPNGLDQGNPTGV